LPYVGIVRYRHLSRATLPRAILMYGVPVGPVLLSLAPDPMESRSVHAMSKRKCLVVGATSTVGHHFVSQLAESALVEPIAATRSPEKVRSFEEAGVSALTLQLDDIESVRAAVHGVNSVFLLTGYTVDMVIQSKIVIDQAVAAGVDQIVHMGAWAPDDTDLGHFGWHQMIERYIEGSGLRWTHVAPGMFMQNMLGAGTLWGSFHDGGVSGSRAIHAFTGEGRLGWIAAEDIARVCVAAIHNPDQHDRKKYNLAVETRSVFEIAQILSETLGRPFHAAVHDPDDFHRALLASGMEPTYAACARETLKRFGETAIPGQHDTFPFEEIVGVPHIDWPEFARRHEAEFLGEAVPAAG
jgi:NAD(P)H dehydrogenase (quinone)